MGTIDSGQIKQIISNEWDGDKFNNISSEIDEFNEACKNLLAKFNEVKAYDGRTVEVNAGTTSDNATKTIKVTSAEGYSDNFENLNKAIDNLKEKVDLFNKEIENIGAAADFIDSQNDFIEQAMGGLGDEGGFGSGGSGGSGFGGSGGSGSGGSGGSSFGSDSYGKDYKSTNYSPYKSSSYDTGNKSSSYDSSKKSTASTSASDSSTKKSSSPTSVGNSISRVSDILTSKAKTPDLSNKNASSNGTYGRLGGYLYASGKSSSGDTNDVGSAVENVGGELAHILESPISDYEGVSGFKSNQGIVTKQTTKNNKPSLAAALFGLGSAGGIVGKKVNDNKKNSEDDDIFNNISTGVESNKTTTLDEAAKKEENSMKDINEILEANKKIVKNDGFADDILDSML